MSKKYSITRRAFLAATTTTAAVTLTGSNKVNAARVVPGKISPNEQVIVGLIGLGGRCRQITHAALGIPEMRIVGACDCFTPRVKAAMKNTGKKYDWNGYDDYRTMIEKENLDGVMVETTTHARAWIACTAMAMGMDAYIEKPMALTIEEGREMVNVARKTKRVTQIGTQQRSIPLNNWASDLIKNGAFGKVKQVQAPNFVGPARWDNKPGQEMPRNVKKGWWDTWCGQTELRPYHEDLHKGWAKWWDYDGGGKSFGVTGWGAHSFDQINRGLGTNETGPVEIILDEPVKDRISGRFEKRDISPDETGQKYYGGAKLTGPRAKVRMKFASGVEVVYDLDGDWGPGLGCIFHCEDGTVEINRDHVSANPAELLEGPDRPDALSVPETEPHIRNWIDCIKTRETCTADIEFGQRSSTLCYLINIVRDVGRVGETLKWDPEAERFTNCDEGNAMLARSRREGYEIPRIKKRKMKKILKERRFG